MKHVRMHAFDRRAGRRAPARARPSCAPPSDEAKAKAAEAAAKTAHGDKVATYQLCKSMDRWPRPTTPRPKKAGKDVKPPVATPACADPGPFVYTPPAAASAPAAAPATSRRSRKAPARSLRAPVSRRGRRVRPAPSRRACGLCRVALQSPLPDRD